MKRRKGSLCSFRAPPAHRAPRPHVAYDPTGMLATSWLPPTSWLPRMAVVTPLDPVHEIDMPRFQYGNSGSREPLMGRFRG